MTKRFVQRVKNKSPKDLTRQNKRVREKIKDYSHTVLYLVVFLELGGCLTDILPRIRLSVPAEVDETDSV